jgi:hypothetical protein
MNTTETTPSEKELLEEIGTWSVGKLIGVWFVLIFLSLLSLLLAKSLSNNAEAGAGGAFIFFGSSRTRVGEFQAF